MAIIVHAAIKATSGGTNAAAHRRHNGGAPIPGSAVSNGLGTAVTSDNSCASLLERFGRAAAASAGDTAWSRASVSRGLA